VHAQTVIIEPQTLLGVRDTEHEMIEAEAGCGRGAGSWWGNDVLAWRVRSGGLVWAGRWGSHNNDLMNWEPLLTGDMDQKPRAIWIIESEEFASTWSDER
jgi:hypothetical protein